MRALLLSRLFMLVIFAAIGTHDHAHAANHPNSRPLWVTMHTTAIEKYRTPCIVSERLLKESRVEFTKILEPMGPWPWFQLTDDQGNQRRINGVLTQDDIEAIKRGEFPERD